MTCTPRRALTGSIVIALLLSLLIMQVPTPIRSASTSILITAIYYDTYLTGEPDEAFRLMNVSGTAVDLTDWTVTDGEGSVTLEDVLGAGQSIWIAREAVSFALEFGFSPDYEYGADTDVAVLKLSLSGALALANTGDELILKDGGGTVVDSVVCEAGSPIGTGWSGPGVYPYSGNTVGIKRFAQQEQEIEGFGVEGQVLYRELDQATGHPVPDTDTVADWAQATDDDISGKRVLYPGWDLDRYFFTDAFTETATITYTAARHSGGGRWPRGWL
jgi:hypothetical protein